MRTIEQIGQDIVDAWEVYMDSDILDNGPFNLMASLVAELEMALEASDV